MDVMGVWLNMTMHTRSVIDGNRLYQVVLKSEVELYFDLAKLRFSEKEFLIVYFNLAVCAIFYH
jgi:hypothetical protein